MSGAASWKVWVIFAGVFLAGGVTGGFVSLRVADRLVERGRSPGQFAPRMIEHLKGQLDLTEAQQSELRVMVEASWEELHQQRKASRETLQALSREIATILTDEQRQKFATMQEAQRKRWQQMAGERRGSGPPRNGPPGAGPGRSEPGTPPRDGSPPPPPR